MLLPNISSLFKWVNNFMPGAKGGSEDFLQCIRQSDGTVLGWIDETGTPRGSLANPPASLAGPGFIYSTNNPNRFNNILIGSYNFEGKGAGFTSGSGTIGGYMFFLPTEIMTSNFSFTVNQWADATDSYDIGIYGPYTGVETTLPLVCHTGPAIYASTDVVATTPWVNSPVSIPAGYYFVMFTTGANLQSSGNSLGTFGSGVGGGNTNNWSDMYFVPTVTTTSSASTLPSTVALSVALVNALSNTYNGPAPLQMPFVLS